MLATLVYLAIQTRQTKFAGQSAARHTATATMNQNTQNAAASYEYAEIVSRGFADQELNPAQWLRFGLWMTGMFHVFQQHYLDSEQGLGDRRVWAGEERAMRDLLGNHETDEFRHFRELREHS